MIFLFSQILTLSSFVFYLFSDRFVQNCSLMNAPTNIGNNLDLFWCYQHTSQKKGKPRCWEFSRDVNHHWFILRGLVKMKLGVSSHGKLIENFKMIKSIKSNEICTSSKYIWIIYVGELITDRTWKKNVFLWYTYSYINVID